MDLRQLKYIVAIADMKNISKAADSLYISQSGLNQQLIKLEKELGMQLFWRNKHHLHLTQAGEIYVRNARRILQIQKNTYTELNELKENYIGNIRLGLTPEHGIDLFTSILPDFNKRYPGITFELKEAIVKVQQELILNGTIDFGIIMDKKPMEEGLSYIPLYEEELVLGVPKTYPIAKASSYANGSLDVVSLDLFREEKFSLIFSKSTMRTVIDPLFEQAGFVPQILFETSMNYALINMVEAGLCCTIIPESRALKRFYKKNIKWFYLDTHPTWTVYVAHKKGERFNKALLYFIELASEYGRKQEKE